MNRILSSILFSEIAFSPRKRIIKRKVIYIKYAVFCLYKYAVIYIKKTIVLNYFVLNIYILFNLCLWFGLPVYIYFR